MCYLLYPSIAIWLLYTQQCKHVIVMIVHMSKVPWVFVFWYTRPKIMKLELRLLSSICFVCQAKPQISSLFQNQSRSQNIIRHSVYHMIYVDDTMVNGDIHVQHPISIFTQKKIKRIVLNFSGKSHNESRVVASQSKSNMSVDYAYVLCRQHNAPL